MSKVILILVLCSQVKREALPILREQFSARVSAIGEAFVGIKEEPGSFVLNPASVSTFPYLSLFCFYNKNFMDMKDVLVGTILKEGKFFISPFFIYSSSGEIEVRDLNDNLIFSSNIQSTYIPGITISGVFKNLYLGLSFKYVYDKIYQVKGKGFLFDLGILSDLNKNLNAGLIFKNLGQGINYDREVFPSPFFARAGFSFNRDIFNLYFDTEYNREDRFGFFSGIEFKIKDILFLRTGYRLVDRLNKFTFGFGIKYKNLNFDYSYQPFYYLGNTHKLSFAISFQKFKEKLTSLYIITVDSFEKLPVSLNLQLEGVLNRKISTDKEGKFFYEGVRAGTLTVRVIDPDFEETEKIFVIEKGKKNVLRMSVIPYKLVSVVFKILDKETNERVGADVYYEGPINGFLKALNGEAEIRRIVTGDYFLKVVPLDTFYNEKEMKLNIYKSDTFYIYLEGQEVELRIIYFETASAEIKEEYIPFLNELGEYLKHRPSKEIILYGHTDSREVRFKYPSNYILSIKRAEAVKNYLVQNFNIDPSRIEIKGFGATRPVAPNTSPQNMAKNRRVVILFKN